MTTDSLRQSLHEHLAWWGLKRFISDAEYFAWQRRQLSPAQLNQLSMQADRKRGGDRCDEVAFYDLTAAAPILPVLYSQRYEYYSEIGARVASRFGDAKRILDFGCGVGILTTFYARLFPEKQFIGFDRSPVSVVVAGQKAQALGLANVRFECVDVDIETELPAGSYELIIATHALVQVEQDPGIPSQSWRTFERARDGNQQAVFEGRTGIGARLDRLNANLVQNGRMIVFEKTRQLARRVPFQRALATRNMRLLDAPEPVRYQSVEEMVDDGPLYVLRKGSGPSPDWDESPEPDEGRPFDRNMVQSKSGDAEAPLFENHWPSAQRAWEQLKDRKIGEETTRQEPDGRQMHVELGTAEGLSYLYCANTFDQRQLVIVEQARVSMLETYYRDIVSGTG